jgi:hypothetical protein
MNLMIFDFIIMASRSYSRQGSQSRSAIRNYANHRYVKDGVCHQVTADQGDTMPILIVNSTDINGMRRVKNFEVEIMNENPSQPVFWALVYCPEGINVNEHYLIFNTTLNGVASFYIPE